MEFLDWMNSGQPHDEVSFCSYTVIPRSPKNEILLLVTLHRNVHVGLFTGWLVTGSNATGFLCM